MNRITRKQNLTYRILLPLFFCCFLLSALASKSFAQGGDASKSPSPTRPTVKRRTEPTRTRRAPQPSEEALSPAERHAKKGEELLNQNRGPEAEPELREAVRLDPNNAKYHNRLAFALVNNQLKHEEAERENREAVRLDPNNPLYRWMHGNDLQSLKRYEEAEAEYKEAIRLKPTENAYWGSLANDLEWENKWTEAEAALREEIRLEPDYAGNYFYLARNLSIQKKWAEAETQYREAIRRASKDFPTIEAEYHDGLGVALSWQGKMAEAEAEFKEAVRLDPSNTSALNNLNQIRKSRP